MTQDQRRTLWVLGILSVLAVTSGWFIKEFISTAGLKEKVEALLSEELESEVTIGTLEGRLFPRVSVSGTNVVVRHNGRTDVPPLLSIEGFDISGSFRDLLKNPRHVSEVRLKGLHVQMPPGNDNSANGEAENESATVRQPSGGKEAGGKQKYKAVIIDRFEAPDTVLTLIPRKAGKQPKVFTIHHLVMSSVGPDQTIPYIATLTNPVPKGEIEASGTFGPWNIALPASTPVTGKYRFDDADLGTINGLSGILRAEGAFKGPLNRIEVDGTTETPDFQVDKGGKAVSLTTSFTAVVDGSDGDTYLNRVDAKFLNTEISAKGAVIGTEGVPGRRVDLDAIVQKGRIEDLLVLAVDSDKPILVGDVQLQAKITIPPEKKKVIDKLGLTGSFGVTQAKFTDISVQDKIDGLSRHGQGMKKEEALGEVLSDLKGRFVLEDARISFSQLSFGVPGALVRLTGGYGIRSEQLGFQGELRLKAKLSEAIGGGFKGLLLKAFDPFFREPGAGAVLPIKIAGTRKDPKFGLNLFAKKKGK